MLTGHPGLRTALHAGVNNEAVVRTLLERGAELNLEDAVGLTPLDLATLDSEDKVAQLLIDAGAAITLPAAIVLERPDRIEQLLREDANALSTTDNRRWARLIVHASGRASGRVMETLLRTVMRHRAGLSIVNMDDDETAIEGAYGCRPLHAAAFHGNTEAIRVLLAHGADPRARDRKYCATPAGWAVRGGHPVAAGLIVEADVDVFDAISLDRGDRIGDILDRDPGTIDRPFRAYASCPSPDDHSRPAPDCTPLEWATARGKHAAVRALTERGAAARSAEDRRRTDRVVTFLQSACWDHHVHGKSSHRMHDRAAQRLLAQDPSIARDSIYTAIVCGDKPEVARMLAAQPEAARQRGGTRGWTPILYLAYTRFTHPPTLEHALSIASLLLDHGANPNDFYMAGDSRYTVLTGIAGEGEQDSPRQPYAAPLFDLLLERGAEPFDIQVLYDTHFSGDMLWWLDLVYRRTIDTPRGAVWKDPEWPMLDMGAYGSGARFLLELAVKKRDPTLAEWALARGANPNAPPARDPRYPKRSLFELAMMADLPEMADLLERYGAWRSMPDLDEQQRFFHACFALRRDEARRLSRAHPEWLQSPSVLFEAAKRDRPDVLALLFELGVSRDVQDQTGKHALHEAAINDARRAAEFLVECGAEIDPRESTYGGTPIGWAAHGDKTGMVQFLSRHSHDLWTLCFHGYADRVREILADDPSRARIVANDGRTLLWWLPDDEATATEMVTALLAAGADPSAKSREGGTAADAARRRGMREVATQLEAAASSQP
jgi:ankyrin repeat protein